jgi:hypothetical protein
MEERRINRKKIAVFLYIREEEPMRAVYKRIASKANL